MEAEDRLSNDELVAFIMHLVVAGHETTTNQMSLSMWALLSSAQADRDRLDTFTDEQWAAVIEEHLRFHAIVRGGPRRAATVDVEVGDVTVRAGEGVYVSIWTANHDPEVYAEPDRWGWERQPGEPEHGALGHGLHQCLGQYLARAELRTAFKTFFTQFPAAELDESPDAVRFGSESTNCGMRQLLVRLRPGRTSSIGDGGGNTVG